jgi:hypothetical protein
MYSGLWLLRTDPTAKGGTSAKIDRSDNHRRHQQHFIHQQKEEEDPSQHQDQANNSDLKLIHQKERLHHTRRE